MTIRFVEKRDGSIQAFDVRKIERAMFSAFNSVNPDSIPNVTALASRVCDELENRHAKQPTISFLHAVVEDVLHDNGHTLAAKAYSEYKKARDKAREERLQPDSGAVANYIHAGKYAKFLPELQRREVYAETVERSRQMHLRRLESALFWADDGVADSLTEAVNKAFDAVKAKRVLPSMRSMQFGGIAIERNNARMYNCSYTLINRLRVFGEAMFALLSGCGVGYSVQFQHVSKLPPLKEVTTKRVKHFVVQDSIEGWADAINELIRSHFVTGVYVEFSYALIRDEGSSLSSGGKAPGHLPLKTAIESIRKVLNNGVGRKLRPIEVHDIVCYIALSVLSGGIRRSSLIAIFSPEDSEMMYAKAHGNYVPIPGGLNYQRSMANNSVALLRNADNKQVFDRVIEIAQELGEPGFYFTNDLDFGCNPCGEIGMRPVIGAYGENRGDMDLIDRSLDFDWQAYSNRDKIDNDDDAIATYGHRTGFQFCNLSEVNVQACESEYELVDAAKSAAVIGTLQAAFSSFPYLGPVTERIADREALIGVGLTAIMDRPEIGLNPSMLRKAAMAVVEENKRVAKIIGINPAARATTVKPSGTSSLELGCVGSGIHYHHAHRYFRRVTANPNEPIAQAFKLVNPHMIEIKPNGDWSINFPVQTRDAARVLSDSTALEFVESVFIVYDNWIVPGSAPSTIPLTHNVSCTITLQEHEWPDVLKAIWENKHRITAMSFLPLIADKLYPFAPREAVSTEADEAKWNFLIRNYAPVDYTKLVESEDGTLFSQEPACAGGVCEL